METAEGTGYGVVQSDELLILSEAIFWSEKEDIDEVVIQQSNELVVSLCCLESDFASARVKFLRL